MNLPVQLTLEEFKEKHPSTFEEAGSLAQYASMQRGEWKKEEGRILYETKKELFKEKKDGWEKWCEANGYVRQGADELIKYYQVCIQNELLEENSAGRPAEFDPVVSIPKKIIESPEKIKKLPGDTAEEKAKALIEVAETVGKKPEEVSKKDIEKVKKLKEMPLKEFIERRKDPELTKLCKEVRKTEEGKIVYAEKIAKSMRKIVDMTEKAQEKVDEELQYGATEKALVLESLDPFKYARKTMKVINQLETKYTTWQRVYRKVSLEFHPDQRGEIYLKNTLKKENKNGDYSTKR